MEIENLNRDEGNKTLEKQLKKDQVSWEVILNSNF